jgi:hypothetical protein
MRTALLRRRIATLPVAFGLSLVLAGQSLAATWSGPIQLTTSGIAFAEGVATVGSSTVLAVYSEHSPEMPDFPFEYAVRLRRSVDSGATWAPHIELASKGFEPDIAARGSKVDVVWTTGGRVRYARSQNGGQAFGSTIALSPTGLPFAVNPSVARGPNGLVAVAWENLNTQVAKVRVSTNGGASFGPMTNVASVAYDLGVKVAVGDGAIHVGFAADFDELQVISSTDEGVSWSLPSTITNDLYGIHDDFDLVAAGDLVYVAFTTESPAGDPRVKLRGSTDSGANWTAETRLSPAGWNAWEPDLSLTGGVLRAVFTRLSPQRVFYRESADGISWTAAEKVARPGYEASVGFATDIIVLYRIGTGDVFARTGS